MQFDYTALVNAFNDWETQKWAAIVIVIVAVIGFILWLVDQLFAPISVMKYGIVGFFGRRGAGKSFGMTTYSRRWRMFNPNKPVFTNMEKLILPGYDGPCTCIHIHKDPDSNNPAEMLQSTIDPHALCHWKINKCKAVHTDCTFARIEACRDGLVAIDEAGIFISSLNFVDRKNRQFARWLVGTRHYKVMVLITAHTPGTVNNRLRDVIDQFILMDAYTTLKIFKGLVYDSAATYGRAKMHSQTVFIPMWWTTSRSYNTDSLRIKADKSDSNVIGEDFEFPGIGEAITNNDDTTQSLSTQTTTNGGDSNGTLVAVDNLSRTRTDNATPTRSGAIPGFDTIDSSLLVVLVSQTAETWNGRRQKSKVNRSSAIRNAVRR